MCTYLLIWQRPALFRSKKNLEASCSMLQLLHLTTQNFHTHIFKFLIYQFNFSKYLFNKIWLCIQKMTNYWTNKFLKLSYFTINFLRVITPRVVTILTSHHWLLQSDWNKNIQSNSHTDNHFTSRDMKELAEKFENTRSRDSCIVKHKSRKFFTRYYKKLESFINENLHLNF